MATVAKGERVGEMGKESFLGVLPAGGTWTSPSLLSQASPDDEGSPGASGGLRCRSMSSSSSEGGCEGVERGRGVAYFNQQEIWLFDFS